MLQAPQLQGYPRTFLQRVAGAKNSDATSRGATPYAKNRTGASAGAVRRAAAEQTGMGPSGVTVVVGLLVGLLELVELRELAMLVQQVLVRLAYLVEQAAHVDSQ